MAPVAVPDKIGVVLVEPHLSVWGNFFISTTNALAQDSFPSFVLSDDVSQPGALRSRIFRVSVVVIKASPIDQDQIALDLLETERTIFIELIVGRLVGILHQRLRTETACI